MKNNTYKFLKYFPYLVFFLSPIYLARLPLGNLGKINLLDILLLVFLLALAKKIYEDAVWRNNLGKYLQSRIIPLIFLSFVFMGLTFSFLKNINSENLHGLGIIKSFFVLPILFSLAINFLIKSNLTKLSICIFSYFSCAGILAILGVIYSIFGQLTFDSRLKIFFDSPNQLAITLAPGIVIGFYYLLRKKISPAWLIIFFFTLIQAYCLWKTASLGAWLGVFASVVFILGTHFNLLENKKTFLAFLALSLVSVFLVFNIEKISPKKDPFRNTGSADSRLVIYMAGSSIIKESPIFGIGPGTFQEKYLEKQADFPPFPQWAVPHSHNLFFHLWLETGLLTFLSVVLLIVYQTIIKRQKKPPLLLGAILIYFLIHGIFDTTIWKNDSALFFWFALLSL